jgi:hypothetical protein
MDEVSLDGQEMVDKDDGTRVKLAKVPSLAELQRMAEVAAGKALPGQAAPAGTAAAPGVSAVSAAPSAGPASEDNLTENMAVAGVGSLKRILAGIKQANIGPQLLQALRDLSDQIDTFLDNNTPADA